MSKINELLDLLDQNENIKEIEVLKNNISKETIDLIKEYQENPSIELKEKILSDKDYKKYLECETNINYLIMNINKKSPVRKAIYAVLFLAMIGAFIYLSEKYKSECKYIPELFL